LTVPENYVVARKLVANMRKGQDADCIDELKGMVVFLSIEREDDQDEYREVGETGKFTESR
jgi:hypothetical protein